MPWHGFCLRKPDGVFSQQNVIPIAVNEVTDRPMLKVNGASCDWSVKKKRLFDGHSCGCGRYEDK